MQFLKSNPYSSRTQDSLPILRAQASAITSEIYDLLKAAPREHIKAASSQLHLFEEVSKALRRDVALSLSTERSLHAPGKRSLRHSSSSMSATNWSRETVSHQSDSYGSNRKPVTSDKSTVNLDEEEAYMRQTSSSISASNRNRTLHSSRKSMKRDANAVSLDEEEIVDAARKLKESQQLLQQKSTPEDDAEARLEQLSQIERDMDQLAEYVLFILS